MQSKFFILTALKGMAMGIAEVIPGVSGGTIAFITGIYERLLNVIKSIGPDLWKGWKADGVKGLWKALDGNFLLALISGMVFGIVVGVFLITYLLETYPLLVWSYFFGLILVSALFVGRQIKEWNGMRILAITIGAVVAYYITISVPGAGNPALYYVFFSGSIAVSALLLPGISGSFILLLMGMYQVVIPTIKSALKTFDPADLIVLLAFGGGMLVGMIVFSRVLSWTFKRFHDATLAVLTGFLLGSLNKIWPWQDVADDGTMVKESGEVVVTFSQSVLPGTFAELVSNPVYGTDPQVLGCILLMVLGFVTVLGAEILSNRLSAKS
jgi:putative membrane protein